MRVADDPRLGDGKHLVQRLTDYLRTVAAQINGLTDGRLAARPAMTAAPTAGTWAQGDSVLNSNPTELGLIGSKYVITGWICTVSGTPGTWVQCRVLTGN